MSIHADLRYALRRLSQAPAYSLAVVLMLSLGIAISSTMFAVLNGVLGSLPFPQAHELVVVESENAERGVREGGLTPAEAMRLERSDSPYASVAYFTWGGLTVFSDNRPREFTLAVVNAGFFETFGLRPQMGRWFLPEEHEAESGSIILSHAEWLRLLGGRGDAVGTVIDTSDGRLRVIGVMPPEFAMPSSSVGAWRPMLKSAFPADQAWVWNARFLQAYGRLDPSVDAGQRGHRLGRISQQLLETHSLATPIFNLGDRPLLDSVVGDMRGVLWGAFAVAMLVLLVACANVAILIDARQVALRHQQSVVQALGASHARILRGLLFEIGTLTLLALAVGALLSTLSVELLRELARGSLPRVSAITVDQRVWMFTLTLGLLVPLMAALGGALRLRGEAIEAMRSGRGVVGSGGGRPWLPALGVALSTAGVVAGSALLLSLWQLQSVDPGLRHHGVYALQYFKRGDADSLRGFADALQSRLQGVPGVQSVAATSAAPLSRIGRFSADLKLPERDQPEPFQIEIRRVSANYQSLLQLPLLEGRGIGAEDDAGSEPVAVVNRELARRLFGEESALNRTVELPVGDSERIAYRIVGVSADTRNRGLRQAPGPELLISFSASPIPMMTLLVHAPKGLPGYQKLLTDALFDVDPRQASARIFTLSGEFDSELASARFFAGTVGALSIAALLLAAFGVYAVAALRQRRRMNELGLRLAVGATSRALATQSLAESARLVALGVGLGLFGGWAALRSLRAQLFGIEGSEAWVVLAGVLLLVAATLLAALAPALRAARTDPMSALRES